MPFPFACRRMLRQAGTRSVKAELPRGPARYRANHATIGRVVAQSHVLEALEPRVLLAAATWISNTDGFFDDPTNWMNGFVPGGQDQATIDKPGVEVTIRQNQDLDSLKASANITIESGHLFTANASEISGNLTLNNGTLLGGFVELVLSGPDNQWTGGDFQQRVTVTGTLTITGDDKIIGGVFINNGTVHHLEGDLLFNGSTAMTNNGLYELADDAGIGPSNIGGGFAPFVNNTSTFRKIGSETSAINVTFNATAGEFDVKAGRLVIGANGTFSDGGMFHVDPGATLELLNTVQDFRFAGTFTGAGGGTVELSGGSYNVTNETGPGATFNFPGDMLQWTGGGIGDTHPSHPFINAGTITLSGPNGKGIGGSAFYNDGTIIDVGPGDFGTGSNTIENRAGAVFEFRGDVNFVGTDQFGNRGIFLNAGTIKKTAGEGTVDISASLNNAGGVIDVQSGTLRFSRGGNSTGGGTFNVEDGAVLEFTGSGDHFNIAGTYTSTGGGSIQFNSFLNGNMGGTNPAVLDFPEGMFHIIGGQLLGDIVNEGFVDFAPTDGLFARAAITNNGTWTHSGDGDFVLNANSRLINNGLYDLQTDADLVVPGDASGGAMNFFNRGVFRKSGGSGASSLRHDGNGKSLTLANLGTIDVQTGTLELPDPVLQFSGSTLTGGEWIVGPGATLSAPVAGNFTINKGRVTLDGAGSTFSNINMLADNRGGFTLLGGRDFTTVGALTNSGRITTGPGSTLTINGALTESSVNSLVGWWRGEDNAVDETGAIDGSLQGNVEFAAGQFGQAFSFDGERDFVSLGNPAALQLQEFTIEGWVKRDSASQGGLIFGYGQSGYTFGLLDDGTPFLSQVGISQVLSKNLQVADTEFHHLAVTRTGGVVTFYVDGVADEPQLYNATFSFFTDAAIGARADVDQPTFVGRIDEVAVFNRALSDDELADVIADNDPIAVGAPASALSFQIADRPATQQFGRLIVSGATALAGTLGAESVMGFIPPEGDSYQVISYTSRSGDFETFDGIAGRYAVSVQPTAVVLTSTPPIDLAATSVSISPLTVQPGDDVTVTYTVSNPTTAAASGAWVDSLYLSTDSTYSSDDLLLARVTHNGGIAAQGQYTEMVTTALPGLAGGQYHVVLIANSRGDAAELDITNNVAASVGVANIELPALTLGAITNDTIANHEDRYYSLTLSAGQDVVLSTNFSATRQGQVFVRYGALPDRSHFDESFTAPAPGQHDLLIHARQSGTYFVLVHGTDGAGGGSAFTLEPTEFGFGATDISPAEGSNRGNVTLTVHGAGFTPDTLVSLAVGNIAQTAEKTYYVDANTLYATFDLTTLPPTLFDLRVEQGTSVDTLSGAFLINTTPAGEIDFHLSSPQIIRAGRAGKLTLDYENIGSTDAPAPLFVVGSDNARFSLDGQAGLLDDFIEVLGINDEGPAGILPPGARGQVTINFIPKQFGPHVFSDFTASLIEPDDTIDWGLLKDDLRPVDIAEDTWDAIYANFESALGTTAGQYADVLRDNATALSQQGKYTPNPDELLQYELFQASDFGSITQRYSIGVFGRGQVDPYNVVATTSAQGNVTIATGGQTRTFIKQANGSYEPTQRGDRGVLTRDGAGRDTITEIDGRTMVFAADGKIDYIQNTNGGRITANYTSGRLTSLVATPGSATTSFAYNNFGRISQMTDAAGRVTTYGYDATGEHLTSITSTLGTVSISYVTGQGAAREHAVASITSPGKPTQSFAYDDLGRLIQSSYPSDQQVMHISYDSVGNATITDALGRVTRGTRSQYDDIVSLSNQSGNVLISEYDANGNPTATTGSSGAGVVSVYDDAGDLTKLIDVAGNVTKFTYDPSHHRLQSITDALGHATTFSYDGKGNLLSTTDAAGQTIATDFDANGRPAMSSSPDGRTIAYTYDAFGSITRRAYSDGTHIDYTYDAHHNLLTATDESGTILFSYDTADRLTKVTYPDGRFLNYTYDSAGRRTKTVDSTGFTIKYVLDSFGRLSMMTDATNALIAGYTYDAANRLTRKDLANGTFTLYDYDDANQLLSITNHAPGGAANSFFNYTYDQSGRRASVTTAEGTTHYGYDETGQLTRVALPGGRLIEYRYDAVGNRTEVIDNGATTTYQTNNVNEYTTAGDTTYTYDNEGNVLSATNDEGTTTYTYNARGQLISTDGPDGEFTYSYNAVGARTAVTHEGTTTRYLIDPTGLGFVFAEFSQSGQTLAHYTVGAGLTSRVEGDGDTLFYDFDAVGNTAALTGAGGSVVSAYTYLPFGEHLTGESSDDNPFTFAGQSGAVDIGDGLYSMRARSYLPEIGRFAQRDPAGVIGGDMNLYRYVGNNPVSYLDPTGLLSKALGDAINFITDSAGKFIPEHLSSLDQLPLRAAQAAQAGAAETVAEAIALREAIIKELGVAGFESLEGGAVKTILEDVVTQRAAEAAALKDYVAERVAQNAIDGTIVEEFEAAAARSLEQTTAETAAGVSLGLSLSGLNIIGAELHIWHQQIQFDREFPEGVPVNNQEVINGDAFSRAIKRPLVQELIKNLQDQGITPSQDAITEFIKLQAEKERDSRTEQITSEDPNDIVGPAGFGDQHFIAPQATLPYLINFFNKPNATAPAQEVVVTQTLDADLDLTTFSFDDFGFGGMTFDVADGLQAINMQIPLSDDLRVDVVADIDLQTRVVTWRFTSIDPATGDFPADPFIGFLPPNVNAPEGEGFVSYTVRARSDAPTGTRVDAEASIVFDVNAPIATPPIFNTIDADAPTSSVTPFTGGTTSRATFGVLWTGDDGAGSGAATFNIYFTDDDGEVQPFALNSSDASGRFVGEVGHTYKFFSQAIDHVGNVGALSVEPDAIVTVVPPVLIPIDGKRAFTDADGDVYTVTLTGDGTLNAVQVGPDNEGRGSLDMLIADGTTSKSKLTVSVKKAKTGDGIVTIGDVVITGDLSSFTAKQSDLIINGLTATGFVGAVTIRDLLRPVPLLADPVIATGGDATQSTKLTLGRVDDGAAITVGSALKSVTAAQIGAASITTPYLKTLAVKGDKKRGIAADLAADVHVIGADAKGVSLASLKAASAVDASIDAAGSIGTVAVTQWINGAINGTSLKSLKASGDKKNSIAGNFSGDVTLTDAAAKQTLGKFTVAGTLLDATITSAGTVGAVTLGAMQDSLVLIGTTAGVTDLAQTAGDFVFQPVKPSLGALTVKGLVKGEPSFARSVINTWIIGKVTLKLVDTADGNAQFGIAAGLIGSVRFEAAGVNGDKPITLKSLDMNADLADPKKNPKGVAIPVGLFTLRLV